MTFDDAVRRLARSRGYPVTDDQAVWSDLGTETGGWGGETIEDTDYVEIGCGPFSLKLEGPDALAQLWAALATVDGGKE